MNKRKLPPEKYSDKYLLDVLKNQGSLRRAARKLDTDHTTLSDELRRRGITLSPPKKKTVKEQFTEQSLRNELRALTRKQTLYDTIGDVFVDAAQKITPPEIHYEPLDVGKIHGEEEMVLMLSDSHLGLTVDPEDTGGLGMYNHDVFQQRMKLLKSSLKNIFEIVFSGTTYKTFNIFSLGDIVENRIMRESQLRLTDLDIVEQIIESVNHISELIGWCSQYFDQVNYYGVVGQHGRLTPKKGVLSPKENFDYLVNHFIEREFYEFDNVKFVLPNSWYMLVQRMNTIFYLEHGDTFYSWMGIPFYGLQRGKGRIREVLSQFERKSAEEFDKRRKDLNFDYMTVAHVHQHSFFNNIMTNGSFVGASEYSLKDLKLGSYPYQMLFSVHPKYHVTWYRPIQLADPRDMPKVMVYE